MPAEFTPYFRWLSHRCLVKITQVKQNPSGTQTIGMLYTIVQRGLLVPFRLSPSGSPVFGQWNNKQCVLIREERNIVRGLNLRLYDLCESAHIYIDDEGEPYLPEGVHLHSWEELEAFFACAATLQDMLRVIRQTGEGLPDLTVLLRALSEEQWRAWDAQLTIPERAFHQEEPTHV